MIDYDMISLTLMPQPSQNAADSQAIIKIIANNIETKMVKKTSFSVAVSNLSCKDTTDEVKMYTHACI